jgi:ligand-binding sensor domain-containing protein
MATGNGFTKFDDENWTKYNPSDYNWTYNKVYDIVSKNGIIWITGTGFLTKISDNGWVSYNELHGYGLDKPVKLVLDKNDKLWFSFYSETNNNFLYSFHFVSSESDSFKNQASLNPVGLILSYTLDPLGDIIIGGSRNFAVYKDTTWIETTIPDSVHFQQINKIASKESSVIWLGTSSGVIKYDGYSWHNFGFPQNYELLTVIEVDKNGTLWAGLNGGVCYLDGNDWIILDKSNSNFPSAHVTDIVFDENNDIWIATFGGGIVRLEK